MLTMDEVLETSCSAILKANKKYHHMSGGMNLHESGIEAFVSAAVAEALQQRGEEKDGGAYCVLEAGPRQIHDWSCAERTKGPLPKSMRQNGRVDVTYFNKDSLPVGLIEIKRHFGWSQMEADLKRLRWLLKRCGPEKGGSVRWGAVVGFHVHWEGSRKALQDRLENFKDNFSATFKDMASRTRIDPSGHKDEHADIETVAGGFSSAGVIFRMKP